MVKKLLVLVLLGVVVYAGLAVTRSRQASGQAEAAGAGGVPAVPVTTTAGRPKKAKVPEDYDAESRRQAGRSTGTGMTREMRARLRRALAAARDAGVELTVTSGWRSAERQQRLFDQAVARYGSRDKASRWVLPPADSEHVKGRAVDVGGPAGMAWLEENGWRFGLCRRYDNEPWHFEPLTRPGYACPPRQRHAVTG
jgi:D-alanyl-D-alanine carboxypeptidase